MTPFSTPCTRSPGAALSQPAANVVHAPRNVIERIVLQPGEIVLHQVGELLIARRQLVLALQQLGESLRRLGRLHEPMMRNRAIEQQRIRRDDVVGRQAVSPGERFVVVALLDEPAGEVQPHVVANQQRRVAIGEPGEFGQLGPAYARPSKTSIRFGDAVVGLGQALASRSSKSPSASSAVGPPQLADFRLAIGANAAVLEILVEMVARRLRP